MILKNTDITLTLTTVQHAEGTQKFTVSHPARLDCKNGTYYITYTDSERNIIKECVFTSPSTAAQFVTGRSTNGYDTWKIEKKKNLGKYLEEHGLR